MDPQQRLLLEHGYGAFHASLLRRATLTGSDGSVFLGIERPDWSLAQPPLARESVYAVTGDNVSVAAGRLSFVFGLQGPCSRTSMVAMLAQQTTSHDNLRLRLAISPCSQG